MKRIIYILFLIPMLASAQFDASMFRTDNQKLVELAVANAFCIVEQAYQLEDTVTHQRFGRYGNENFGKSSALGVRLGANVVFSNSILKPWEQDANFQRYRDTHRPVLSRLEIKDFNDSTISRRYNPTADSISISEFSSMLSMVNDSIDGLIGFSPKQSDKEEKGWFVWVMGDSIGELPSLSIYTKAVDFSQTDEPIAIDAPRVDKPLWGGVFIVPEQAKIGQLDFYIYGILSQVEDDTWVLEPFRELNFTQQPNPEDELTPTGAPIVKEKKDKKKKK